MNLKEATMFGNKFRRLLKKPTPEAEERFRKSFEENDVGASDVFAMLVAAFLTIVLPCLLVLCLLAFLAMLFLGLI